ncbi:MAG: helix-turn-helix transcriptional regulator [Clostridia bacterium]|nr:helix-turn-helix transcriptional regulator [Clostridia bacterium]
MAIHSTLSAVLGAKRITQKKLAEITGISTTTVCSLYNDKVTKVSYDVLNKICKTLDCQVSDILTYVPDEEEN